MVLDEQDVAESDLVSYKFTGEDFEVTLGEGDTLLTELLDKVLMSMEEGETGYIKSKVSATGQPISELGFSAKGLNFNISLKSLNRAADSVDLEPDESLDRAQHHKDKGTSLFKEGRFTFAEKRFIKSIGYLEQLSPTKLPLDMRKQCRTLQTQIHLNMAACNLKAEKWDIVIKHCDVVISEDDKNVKALYRKGLAYTGLLNYDNALIVMNRASAIDPNNKAVLYQIQTVHKLIKKNKEVYQKMFK